MTSQESAAINVVRADLIGHQAPHREERRTMRAWWIGAVVLVIAGVAAVAILVAPTFASGDDVEYITAAARVTDVTDAVVATGTIQAATSYELKFGEAATAVDAGSESATDTSQSPSSESAAGGSNVEWPVLTVDVQIGDVVEEGATLATADTVEIDADISVAESQVEAAQAQVDSGSPGGEAQLAEAEETLSDLEAQRDYATLVAPAAGTVTAMNVTAGFNAGSEPAVVIASDAYVASGTVTESDVTALSVGQDATVTVTALDADGAGAVSYISPTGSSSSGVVGFTFEVALDDVPDGVRPGMSADISVVIQSVPDALAVPVAALGGPDGAYTVRVLADAEPEPEARAVEVGLVTDEWAQITDGLSEGELVVTGTAAEQTGTDGQINGFPGGGQFPGGGPGGGQFPGGGD
jgi:membrane fusion protein, macrolide-specific efflux system